ncbi:MAG: DUF2066 domain-containing protein [Dokdonella sp.]
MRPSLPLRLLGFALLLLIPLAASAAPGSYTGEAAVNSQSDVERAEALKTALANVVISQTGDSGVLARSDVSRAVAQAERYVLQYQYRRNPGNGDDGSAKMTLIAQFDSNAVDQLLRRLGIGAGSADAAAAAEAPSEATVWISGIRNANDYARVIGYLGRNNFVRNAQPVAAHEDGVLVKLSLATELAKFLDAVGMERTLGVVNAPAKAEGVDAMLALSP